MFGKLKEKLKSALSVFSKKTEEEAEVLPAEEIKEIETPIQEKKSKKETAESKPAENKPVEKKEKEIKTLAPVKQKKETFKKSEEKKENKFNKLRSKAKENISENKITDKLVVEEVVEPEHILAKIENKAEDKIEDKTTFIIEAEEPENIDEQPKKKGLFGRWFGKKEEAVEEDKKAKKEQPAEESEEVKEHDIKEEPAEAAEDLVEEKRLHLKEEIEPAEHAEKKTIFGKLKQALTTKQISEDKFEELFWDLELVLLENNVSVEVIERIKSDLKTELVDKPLPRDVPKKIEETLRQSLKDILSVESIDVVAKIKSFKSSGKPFVIAFFGVNGTGKTTSIAKLTHYLQQQKLSVVLAACDTFRAAAIQQLEEHANKLGVKIIKHEYGSDAAAVAFDAIKYAEKNKVDVVLIDTAGRLHSNTNLMLELEKIIRVTKPNLKIFVGESITGNDCIEQARKFDDLVEMDGAILTKADVDEKGGAPLSISYTLKKPILVLGVGQGYSDLEKFNADVILKRLGF